MKIRDTVSSAHKLRVSNKLDDDGDLCIEIKHRGQPESDAHVWISRGDIDRLVEHLDRVAHPHYY